MLQCWLVLLMGTTTGVGLFQWARELFNLVLMPVLDVDAISIALSLKQHALLLYTWCIECYMEKKNPNPHQMGPLLRAPWAWTISVL